MKGLLPHNPAWLHQATDEIARWHAHVEGLVTVHHIGSTSIPDLIAKPVIDLLPVFASDAAADRAAQGLGTLGYECLGGYGIEGRRYARRNDPDTGKRLVQAHGYVVGHRDIQSRLAFRDALRDDAALREAYACIKRDCAHRTPGLGPAYGKCKSAWIKATEVRALARATLETDA